MYADEAIDAITAYKTVKNNIRDIQQEISLLAKSGSTAILSTETMIGMGEKYNRLKGVLELLTNEADRIWHQHEDFFATSGIAF